ncbi:MAG: ComEC/Rec2 family competence protein [Chloroflexi bacterium]|nr:ComEC/Rec2 family competence protein [Chloroflexota bacterium]
MSDQARLSPIFPWLATLFALGLVLSAASTTSIRAIGLPLSVGLTTAASSALVVCLLHRRWPPRMILVLLALGLGSLRGLAPGGESEAVWNPPAGRIELRGTIDAPVQSQGASDVVFMQADPSAEVGLPRGGRVRLITSPLAPFESGDRILALGTFAPLDLESPFARSLSASHVVGTSAFPEIVALAGEPRGSPLSLWLHQVRAALTGAIAKCLPEPQAGLVSGLLVGTTGRFSDDLRQALITSGTTQLVVVSGYNISLISAALTASVPRSGRLATIVPLLGIWLFTLISGANPPAIRAALMGTVALATLRLGRGGDALASLLLTVAGMLAWAPELATDLSFQLSATATIGLVALQARVAALMPRLPTWLREPFAATIAAQLATVPILATAFHQISAVAPIANALAAPAVPILTIAGAVTAAIVAILPATAAVGSLILALPTAYLLVVIQTAASLPGALIYLGGIPAALTAVYALVLLAWAGLPTPEGRAFLDALHSRRLLISAVAGAAIGLLIGIIGAAITAPRSPMLELTLFDAGGAPALFARTPLGQTILVDSGRSAAATTALLGENLQLTERALSIVALTRSDADRLPGSIAAVERYPPSLAIAPADPQPGSLYQRWARAAKDHLTSVQAPTVTRVEPGLEIEFLPTGVVPGNPSEFSLQPALAVRITYGQVSVLFAPTATPQTLLGLMEHSTIQADVLVVPRGGESDALDPASLAGIAPRVALIPVDASSRSSSPDPKILSLLSTIDTFRTDLTGSIQIKTDGKRVWISPERIGSRA